MKKIIILMFLLSASCSTLGHRDLLYRYYLNLNKTSVDTTEYINFFSRTIQKKYKVLSKKERKQLKFSNFMQTEVNHYESVSGTTGCLAINGLDENNKPIVYSFEYKNIDKKWLISDVDIAFVETKKNYVIKAVCPKEVRVQ